MKINLPEEFKKNMTDLLGDDAVAQYFEAMDEEPVSSFRLNPLKKHKNDLVYITKEFPTAIEAVSWEKMGRYYTEPDRPGKHPLHAAGAYYIQEASAMAPAALLMAESLRGEEKILDLCAAPGGKTTQIASYMKGRGLLVANEIIPSRAKILSENVERCGIKNCVVTNCTPQEMSERFTSFFDRIMVDAPCSGEGMFRKNPEAVKEWSMENVKICANRQDEILDCAADMLSPGGIMVYSTCTFNRLEDEGSVERFLVRHPEFRLDYTWNYDNGADLHNGNAFNDKISFDDEVDISNKNIDGISQIDDGGEKTAKVDIMFNNRILPHTENGEGQFFVRLVKEGNHTQEQTEKKTVEGYENSLHKILNKEQIKLFEEWCDSTCGSLHNFMEVITDEFYGDSGNSVYRGDCGNSVPCFFEVRVFGSNLYLVPGQLPDMSHLKVLRWGLHLGSFEKKRFEPSHALALVLGMDDVTDCVQLSMDEAVQYLKGMSVIIPQGSATGWTLVCYEGFSLGWGKAVGGMLKNHYPKGLRWM